MSMFGGDNGPVKKRVQISFDDLNRIRILEADDFKQTEELADQCHSFVEKTSEFITTVDSLVNVLQTQSTKIENEKMLAIGQRNRIDTEVETRRRRQAELQYEISQRKAELQRAADYTASLLKVEQEQRLILERLQA